MLVYHQFDPVAVHLGPLSIRWYGLMYVAGFIMFIVLGRIHAKRRPELGWNRDMIDDLLFYGILGVVIGGRLGGILFYEPGYYFSHPAQMIAVWNGGMSFHGGLIGVLLAMAWFARKTGRSFLEIGDFVAPLVPIGLFFGRMGNFINGELWGRPADPHLPWAMIFPQVDNIPRHPSQLYEAAGEGLLLFAILWIYATHPRATGRVSGLFLICYGIIRFSLEFFRHTDPGIFSWVPFGLSTAQWLCVPMVLAGIWLLARTSR